MSDLNFLKSLDSSKIITVKKGEILVRNGDPSDNLFYVIKGCLRSYIISSKGKEHVFQFAPEDWIISARESQLNNGIAILNIDAIEDSEVKIIQINSKDKINDLDKESLLDMNNKLLKRNYAHQKRIIQLLSSSAQERYTEFIKIYPNLVQRVPQYMIASYLGITPEGLSRVRKELVRKNKIIS